MTYRASLAARKVAVHLSHLASVLGGRVLKLLHGRAEDKEILDSLLEPLKLKKIADYKIILPTTALPERRHSKYMIFNFPDDPELRDIKFVCIWNAAGKNSLPPAQDIKDIIEEIQKYK